MGTLMKSGDTYIRSRMQDDPDQKVNPQNYGNNGYVGSSRVNIGEVSSGFLSKLDGDLVKAKAVNTQNRTVDGSIATHPFMKGAAPGPKLGAPVRPVKK
jgi:hypothetical protein